MRTIQQQIYTFEELTDKAKEKARQWFRDGDEFDPEMEPFETAAKILGITFGTRTKEFAKDNRPDIRWSGFSSQGDGASFVGSYEFARGCSKAIRTEFGEDTALHGIADALTVIQSRYLLACGTTLTANITQSGNYVHKNTMHIEVDTADGETRVMDVDDADALSELMRDFAQWIYDGLQADYDDRQSDEYVDDCIIGNDYEFTEEGEKV